MAKDTYAPGFLRVTLADTYNACPKTGDVAFSFNANDAPEARVRLSRADAIQLIAELGAAMSADIKTTDQAADTILAASILAILQEWDRNGLPARR